MRVVLEVVSGESRGRKATLQAGQLLQVGHTEWADVVLAYDPLMSPVHFALYADRLACYVQDLASSNGTLVNGRRITGRTALRNGDQIRAGETAFAVAVEGDAPSSAASLVESRLERTDAGPSAMFSPRASEPMEYMLQTCVSGLLLCRGLLAGRSPAVLARQFGDRMPLYLVIHLGHGELPQVGNLPRREYLMDWLPEESRTAFSPVFIAPSEPADLASLVESVWGQDAAVAILSENEPAEVLCQVRAAAGAFLRPSTLASQLAVGPPGFVGHLLLGIQAVFLEGVQPTEWRLFCESSFERTLESLGFVRRVEGDPRDDARGPPTGRATLTRR